MAIWTPLRLARWSNLHSTGGEVYLVHPDRPGEPVYVGSYAVTLKPEDYAEGWRLFRASYGRDLVSDIEQQLSNPSQVSS